MSICPRCGTEMQFWEVVGGDEDKRTGEIYQDCPSRGYEESAEKSCNLGPDQECEKLNQYECGAPIDWPCVGCERYQMKAKLGDGSQ